MSTLGQNVLKEWRTGSIAITGSNSNLSVFTSGAIIGRIYKVFYQFGDSASTGSTYILISGTNEQVHQVLGNTNTSAYPRAIVTNSLNTNLSGLTSNIWGEYVSNAPLRITGSGLNTSGGSQYVNDVAIWYF